MANPREMSESISQPGSSATQPPPPRDLATTEAVTGGLLRGQQLGPYLLVERLGGGAMATVYRAVDQRNSHAVAIKVLRPDADSVMRERFRREAETHSNLNHPNIVQILDVGQAPGSELTYIAMELIDGPDLSEVLEETTRLSPPDAALLLEPIAAALDYARRQGVIHRDVKPSNVLLRRVHAGTPNAVHITGLDMPVLPLLSDFGIARALDAPELTSVGRTIGTPTYMSPEQCADSHEIDGRSDLYSLGAVFYRCVVGRPPYGGTTTQILHAHVYDPLTIPNDLLADLPPLAVTILRRTLAKDPAQRYGDGGELAADLHRLFHAAAGAALNGSAEPIAGEATATMPVLPVTPLAPGASGQTVLVPAPEPAPTQTASPAAVAPLVLADRPQQASPPRVVTTMRAAVGRPRRRWIGAVVGGVLAALVLIFGGGLALNLLPDELAGSLPLPDTAPITLPSSDGSPPAVALAPTADAGAATAGPPPTAIGAADGESGEMTGGATGGEANGVPPVAPAPAQTAGAAGTPLTTPAPLPTPAGDVRSYWAEAEAAYQDGDWENALAFLTLARRIDPRYEGETADRVLFESHVGLAADAITTGNLDVSLEHLDAAVTLRPEVGRVKTIQAALQALVAPGTLNISMARWTLATALGSYAQELLNAENPCAAAEQLQAAVTLAPVESSAKLLAETQATCDKARRDAGLRRQLVQLSGRILYSTQEGDGYRIYRAPATVEATSALLIEDGTQPARQWRSNVVAFHNTQAGNPGIALFDPAAGQAPATRSLQLTTSPGDARDAPPSWSANDRSLVYGYTEPADGRTRLFRVEVNASAAPVDLGPGRDPAWSPQQDRIVFNGVNEEGGEPGLWLMNGDGGNRQRLTDNGNDIRPVWTPDGLSLVFMSSRDGNWEVYRLNLLTAELTRLTTNSAQDGLPTVSPDGKWVAYASDRGGYWRIWVTPLDGGEAQPLVTIEGVLTNWLEHAIQWIP
jgi:eukaryotic-like serine/threonine-protein kinase